MTRIRAFILIATFSSFVMFAYTNCGQVGQSVGLSQKACVNQQLQPVFQDGFHSFFKENNCNNCHATGRSKADVPFADDNVSLAFGHFSSRGPDFFINKLSGGHQAYTFQNIESDLIQLKADFEQQQNSISCSTEGFLSAPKNVEFYQHNNTFDVYTVLPEFYEILDQGTASTLDDEKVFKDWVRYSWEVPSLPGVTITMGLKAKIGIEFDLTEAYFVNDLTVTSEFYDIRVQGVRVLLNGSDYSVTTFTGIDATILKGSYLVPLNPSGATAVFVKEGETEKYGAYDTFQIQVDVIKRLN